MTCPVCGEKTKVLETRADTDCIRRRRECIQCQYTFITIEICEDLMERLTKEIKHDKT